MRVDFTRALGETLAADKRAVFMTGDLGYANFEALQKEFTPSGRFINCGVAEQNMVGVAAGLAMSGFRPWVYSIAPFLAFRAVEQIRNDVCFHNLPVRVVGNGGGFTYGIMGGSHHALEDMATMKALPNMTIFAPATNSHAYVCTLAARALDGPCYLRLGFSGFQAEAPPLSENPRTLTRRYSRGARAVVVGFGQGTQIALKALEERLLDAQTVSVFGVAKFPFDLAADRDLAEACARAEKIVLVEEHYRAGSLAESFRCELRGAGAVEILTPEYRRGQLYGSGRFHLEQAELTPARVAQAADK